jgi:hypothetical protein
MQKLVGFAVVSAFVWGVIAIAPAAETLDYEMFKTRVEPLFLKHRAGHARCYTCHAESNNAFHLERLSAGSTFWSEEQSRRNFDTVSAIVVPGDVAASKLLQHPLAPEAGGESYHSGGRQFASKGDPDWQMLAAWVNGRKR